MTTPIHILGIAGSLRRDSYNRSALRAAARMTTVEFFNKLLRNRSRTGVSGPHCFTAELSTPCCFSLDLKQRSNKDLKQTDHTVSSRPSMSLILFCFPPKQRCGQAGRGVPLPLFENQREFRIDIPQ